MEDDDDDIEDESLSISNGSMSASGKKIVLKEYAIEKPPLTKLACPSFLIEFDQLKEENLQLRTRILSIETECINLKIMNEFLQRRERERQL